MNLKRNQLAWFGVSALLLAVFVADSVASPHNATHASDRATLIQADLAWAKQRQARMRDLIIKDPAVALRHSLTRGQWASLPEEIRPYVEEPFSGVADVEVFIGCLPDSARIERVATLSDGTTFRAYTNGGGGRFNRTRKGIQVEGIRMGDVGVLRDEAVDVREAATEASLFEQAEAVATRHMYVILVDFSDLPGQPADPVTLENLINGPVSEQIYDMSFHQTAIECTVNPTTYRLPDPISVYEANHLPMYDDAVAAVLADGVDLSPYGTICVYFANFPAIEFAGYASIDGEKMWINGYMSERVITHELGHNYGSYHAHSWNVSGSDPVDPAGTHEEYGDPLDIMGQGQLSAGHFHIQNKLQVGWLDTANFMDVTTSGTYRIFRSDHPQTDPVGAANRGLRLDKGAGHYYWLGYRQGYPEKEYFGRGLYVLWQKPDPNLYQKSHLLDMSPGTSGGKLDGGLAMGATYSDLSAGIHITPVARGGQSPNEYMDVAIHVGDFSGNLLPTASISGPAIGSARESLQFSIDAEDLDGDTLAYAWDFGDGLIKPNAAQVCHAWMNAGSFTVRCTVSDMKGGVVVAEHFVTVSDPLEEWPHQLVIPTSDLFDITVGGGLLVAVGKGGIVAVSSNGIDWTVGNLGGFYTNIYLYSVIFDGAQFVAAGMDYNFAITSWIAVIYTSPDGTTWTRRYDSGAQEVYDIAYGNGTWVAVGKGSTILRSVNGTTWSPVYIVNNGDLRGISFQNGVFTAVGTVPLGGSLVYTSTDGTSWSNRSAMAGTGDWGFSDIELCNDLLLAGGALVGIRYSDNQGTSFSIGTDDYLQIPAFAYGNGVYFAAGTSNFAGTPDVNLVSLNGISWVSVPAIPQQDRTAAVFHDNGFITVGKSGSVWKSAPVTPPDSGYAIWQYQLLPELGLDRDPDDDGDGDGAFNIVEYAVGTDPADPSSVPVTRSSVDASGYLHITIERTRAAPDVDYLIERASVLDNESAWDSVETVPVSETDTELVVRSTQPLSILSPQFLRLRVRFAEPGP